MRLLSLCLARVDCANELDRTDSAMCDVLILGLQRGVPKCFLPLGQRKKPPRKAALCLHCERFRPSIIYRIHDIACQRATRYHDLYVAFGCAGRNGGFDFGL